MFTLLVAEDLPLIRQGLVDLIRQGPFAWGEIFQAADGEEALRIARRERPDLIITDIRMPGADGLELIEAVGALLPRSRFVIISGHADFHYAQRALKLGVSEYLLKPIKEEEFYQALDQARRALQKRRRSDREAAEDRMARLRDFLRALPASPLPPPQLTREFLARLEAVTASPAHPSPPEGAAPLLISSGPEGDRPPRGFQILRLRVSGGAGDASSGETEAFLGTLRRCGSFGRGVFFRIGGAPAVLRLLPPEGGEAFPAEWEEQLSPGGKALQIGLSSLRPELTGRLYDEAGEALLLRFCREGGRLFSYREDCPPPPLPREELRLFQRRLEKRDRRGWEESLEALFPRHPAPGRLPALWGLAGSIIIRSFSRHWEYLSTQGLQRRASLDAMDDPDQVRAFLGDLLERLREKERADASPQLCLAEQIQNHIDARFTEEISLAELSARFCLSSSYLTRIFKSRTGRGVSRYIMEKRLERACALLRSTDLCVSDISEQAGYEDLSYFYRLFKKHRGMTPLSYRNAAREED